MASDRLSRRHLLTGLGLAATAGLAGCASSRGGSGARFVSPTAAPGPGGTGSGASTPGHAGASGSATPARSANPSAKATTKPGAPAFDEAAVRRKLASLLVVGFRGQSVGPNDWIVKAIRDQGLGGVILFDRDQLTGARRNISSPSQVTSLIRSLKAASPSGRLIVSIDQEGGRVARLNPADGFPATRSEAQIGAVNSASATKAWADGIVSSLTSIGVTMNFAPVVDLDVNPGNPAIGQLGRSFSADPSVVTANAGIEIKSHRAAGVKTSLKHFPGFGSATGNTDFGVVDVSKTWRPTELTPFKDLIAAGTCDSVLVAHLLNTQLDPKLPASLSRSVVTGLLRGQLGWRGPVVSDDMQAAAITQRYGAADAAALAVEAGVDLLVYANQQVYDANVVEATLNTLVGLVKGGHISQGQVDAAVARVDSLRPR